MPNVKTSLMLPGDIHPSLIKLVKQPLNVDADFNPVRLCLEFLFESIIGYKVNDEFLRYWGERLLAINDPDERAAELTLLHRYLCSRFNSWQPQPLGLGDHETEPGVSYGSDFIVGFPPYDYAMWRGPHEKFWPKAA